MPLLCRIGETTIAAARRWEQGERRCSSRQSDEARRAGAPGEVRQCRCRVLCSPRRTVQHPSFGRLSVGGGVLVKLSKVALLAASGVLGRRGVRRSWAAAPTASPAPTVGPVGTSPAVATSTAAPSATAGASQPGATGNGRPDGRCLCAARSGGRVRSYGQAVHRRLRRRLRAGAPVEHHSLRQHRRPDCRSRSGPATRLHQERLWGRRHRHHCQRPPRLLEPDRRPGLAVGRHRRRTPAGSCLSRAPAELDASYKLLAQSLAETAVGNLP